MFRSIRCFDPIRIWLLLASAVWACAGGSLPAAAQTTTHIPTYTPTTIISNPNPNNFDSRNIMRAIAYPPSDLVVLSTHRGIHALAGTTQAPNVPENSLESIALSAQAGMEVVELDVQVTSDRTAQYPHGVPILTHDRSWGREWCGQAPLPYGNRYDPLIQPGKSTGNDRANPQVANTLLTDTRSFLGSTVLRDSVSVITDRSTLGCPTSVLFYGEYPPTLEDALAFIKNNSIHMVIALDAQEIERVQAAWAIVQNTTDDMGRLFSERTVFKVPSAILTPRSNVVTMFGDPGYTQAHVVPVISTSAIAPTGATNTDLEQGGFDVSAAGKPGFGGEPAIIAWLNSLEKFNTGSGPLQIPAVEVVLKESGGILTQVLTSARTNQRTGNPMTIGNFNPVGEYFPPDDTNTNQTAQFFRSGDGSCCDTLAQYWYNNPNGKRTDPNQPIDTSDQRNSLDFLVGQGNRFITTDNVAAFDATYPNLRNMTIMRAGGPLGFTYCSAENANCILEGPSWVAFGPPQGPFNYGYYTSSVGCVVSNFGPDPAPGVVKTCYFQTVGANNASCPIFSANFSPSGSSGSTGSGGTPCSTATAPPLAGRSTPIRILVDGDSMTAGREGDYTWRYRLLQWFNSQGIAVQFVGPTTGVQAPMAVEPPEPISFTAPAQPMTGTYGSAADQPLVFNSQHTAVWGKPVMVAKSNIAQLVQQYQPDLVLVALGFNDMGWFYSDDVGTLASMRSYIQNAQAVDPYLQFVVADVPYRTYIGGRDDLITKTGNYDANLPPALSFLETIDSKIGLAEFNNNYGCVPKANTCDSTYDGLHPNYKGEFRIAQAFASALHNKFNLGTNPTISIAADTVRPLTVPTNLVFDGTNEGVTVTWNRSYGATGYNVQWREAPTATGVWGAWNSATTTFERFDLSWQFTDEPFATNDYQVEVAAAYGDPNNGIASAFSEAVQGTPQPRVSSPPTNVSVTPIAGGFNVSWSAPQPLNAASASIYEYDVWLADQTTGAWPKIVSATGTSTTVTGLVSGHPYTVYVEAWNPYGASKPAIVGPYTPN